MKKHLITFLLVFMSFYGMAQQRCYWVFFTDKNGTEFDPYAYFDAKAIERYNNCGANLYDISNFPLNQEYVSTVDALSDEVVGTSRWLNAAGVMASDANINAIRQLPFVSYVQEIESTGTIAGRELAVAVPDSTTSAILSDQLIRFGGQHFIDHGIDGKGMRIAVLDAGFPGVDKHPAFKHLRDDNRILKTYNFPKKCENVYGWGSHGTMVLSCIAGMKDGQKLGLATGAEFLLARTEIDPEPFKEEIWWAEAAEWADKNGADIINSSLGYGKDRHYTRDMNGESYVAKAANKAVEKGILVCNSAGNEGDDSHWMTIITPSDAENVLCIGGIDDNLNTYRHINFSSYGPSADKRLKPNVCAFGQANVASPKGGYTVAAGTSFSSPLTAGFCACAWQTRRDLTALEMKSEIEKSADLYPYYDYAFGYGVPQAAYFTNELKPSAKTFALSKTNDGVLISLEGGEGPVFVNIEGDNGVLLGYYQFNHAATDSSNISFSDNSLGKGKKINVWYNGYYNFININGTSEKVASPDIAKSFFNIEQNGTFPKIKKEKIQSSNYFDYIFNLPNATWNGYASKFNFGFRKYYGKTYKLGYGLNIGGQHFKSSNVVTANDTRIKMSSLIVGGEVFQRVVNRMWGVNWDLGAYGTYAATRKVTEVKNMAIDGYNERVKSVYYGCDNMNRLQYGATTRFSYTFENLINLGLVVNYRLSDIITGDDIFLGSAANNPSRWGVGIELEIMK